MTTETTVADYGDYKVTIIPASIDGEPAAIKVISTPKHSFMTLAITDFEGNDAILSLNETELNDLREALQPRKENDK